MFGLSFTHLIILAVIVLIFIGPEQLPQVARTFARLLNEWKRATGDIQSSLTQTLRDDFSNRMNDPHPPTHPIPTPAEVPAQHDAQSQVASSEVSPVVKKDEHGS